MFKFRLCGKGKGRGFVWLEHKTTHLTRQEKSFDYNVPIVIRIMGLNLNLNPGSICSWMCDIEKLFKLIISVSTSVIWTV